MEVDQPSSSSSSAPKKRFEVLVLLNGQALIEMVPVSTARNASGICFIGKKVECCGIVGLGHSCGQLCYLPQSHYGFMH